MIAMLGQHSGSVWWSIALHVAMFAALIVSFRFSLSPRVAAVPAPIQGVIVDQSQLQKEQQRRDQDAQRKQREDRERRELVEQQQREQEAADKRERERVATEQRQREQERVAKQKAEQEAREQQAREDAARKQKEALAAKQRAQAEDDLRRELAAEAERQEAERAGVVDEYARQIQAAIEHRWIKPLSAKPGLECVVNVVQLPTGEVYDAKVDERHCNGDDAVQMSIVAAVKKASPLPKPPSQAVFERNLVVTFKPQDVESGIK